jgi:hypothetical protein
VVGLLVVLIVLGSIGSNEGGNPVATRPQHTTPKRPKPAPAPPPPKRVTLQLIPSGQVYVCLRTAADVLVLNETLTPQGGTRTFNSRHFKLTVGNSSLSMKINGKQYGVQPSATATTFEVTPTGRRILQNENAC